MPSIDLVSEIQNGSKHRGISDDFYRQHINPIYSKLPKYNLSEVKFDPSKHLDFDFDTTSDKTRTLTTKELGLSSPKQITEIGVSDPFPLFTQEAVDIMRQEILEPSTFKEFARYQQSSSTGRDCAIRGYAKFAAPFTYEAWTHPETIRAISQIAGVDVQVIMDYEVAHINVGIKSAEEAQLEIEEHKAKLAEGKETSEEKNRYIVGWHNDSYPLVCVLMLSDTQFMIGGETSLRTGNGDVVSVCGPKIGHACILQGRLIEHIAPSPLGAAERITSVTSYRAKDPLIHEGSVLKTVKPEINYGSNYNSFYKEWIDYRMDVLQARLKSLQVGVNESPKFDKEATTSKLKEIEDYLQTTYLEMAVSEDEWKKASKGLDL